MSQSQLSEPTLGLDQLSHCLPQIQAASHCYLAYSGGLDSHVLLHLISRLLPQDRFSVLHINHQLSPDARQWAEHCERTCSALGVTLQMVDVRVENDGQGLEAAARQARYRIFEQQLGQGDLLLQAHHADDQAETLLYRLLRGAGAKGLAGIPSHRALGKGQLIRPLLGVSRAQIEQYGRYHQLQWIEDESNSDERFDRNFLRHQVIPVLAQRWPDYTRRIATSAASAARSYQLDRLLAERDFAELDERRERSGWSLKADKLSSFSEEELFNLLRYWLEQHGFEAPGSQVLQTVQSELLPAGVDAQPIVAWAEGCFRRFQQRIYLLPPAMSVQVEPGDLDALGIQPGERVQLPDGNFLESAWVEGRGLRLMPDQQLEIRFRHSGERCKPTGRKGSNTLKKLFQEYHLEPWLRNRAPLIYQGEQLIAVADLWVCEGFAAQDGEKGLDLRWVFR